MMMLCEELIIFIVPVRQTNKIINFYFHLNRYNVNILLKEYLAVRILNVKVQ